MHACTTLALILSLSACEHASPPPPSTPAPAAALPPPAAAAAPRATPKVEAKRPLPKVPCRARVCPEWTAAPADPVLAAPPTAVVPPPDRAASRPAGVSRAGVVWRGEAPKVRIQQVPAPETRK